MPSIFISHTFFVTTSFNFNTMQLTSWQKQVIQTVEKCPGAWICGGAALALYTNKPQHLNDFDVFCLTNVTFLSILDKLKQLGWNEYEVVERRTRLRKESVKIDLVQPQEHLCRISQVSNEINQPNTVAEHILNFFDLTICQIAFRDTKQFVLTPLALTHIKTGVMTATGEYIIPELTKQRIIKYTKRGYKLVDFSNLPTTPEEAVKNRTIQSIQSSKASGY